MRVFGVLAVLIGTSSASYGVAAVLAPGDPNCVAVAEGKAVPFQRPGGGTGFHFEGVRPTNRCRIHECAPSGSGDLCTITILTGPGTLPNHVFVKAFCKCSSDPGEPAGCRTVTEGQAPPGGMNTPGQYTVSCTGPCVVPAGSVCRLGLDPLCLPPG